MSGPYSTLPSMLSPLWWLPQHDLTPHQTPVRNEDWNIQLTNALFSKSARFNLSEQYLEYSWHGIGGNIFSMRLSFQDYIYIDSKHFETLVNDLIVKNEKSSYLRRDLVQEQHSPIA